MCKNETECKLDEIIVVSKNNISMTLKLLNKQGIEYKHFLNRETMNGVNVEEILNEELGK